jgi:transposase
MTASGCVRNSKPEASSRASLRAAAANPLHLRQGIYRQRDKVENLFAKLKDRRRIATRYDRYAHIICIPAALIFWL